MSGLTDTLVDIVVFIVVAGTVWYVVQTKTRFGVVDKSQPGAVARSTVLFILFSGIAYFALRSCTQQ